MRNTKQGAFEDDFTDERNKELELRRTEYFHNNPEAEPWRDEIVFKWSGKTVSIDDSIMPKEIKNIIRQREGRKLLP